MLTRRPGAHAVTSVLIAVSCLGRTIAAQDSSNASELAASMESAQRCLATRDTIAAANDIRSCSVYTLSMANRSQGQSQTALLSASYALDSLADRIEMGHGLRTPAAALERGTGFTVPDVVRALIALHETLMATRP